MMPAAIVGTGIGTEGVMTAPALRAASSKFNGSTTRTKEDFNFFLFTSFAPVTVFIILFFRVSILVVISVGYGELVWKVGCW